MSSWTWKIFVGMDFQWRDQYQNFIFIFCFEDEWKSECRNSFHFIYSIVIWERAAFVHLCVQLHFGLASVYPLSDLRIRYKVYFARSREAGGSVSIWTWSWRRCADKQTKPSFLSSRQWEWAGTELSPHPLFSAVTHWLGVLLGCNPSDSGSVFSMT